MVILIGFLFGIGLTSHYFANPSITQQDALTNWLLTFADADQTTLASEKLTSALSGLSGDVEQTLTVASRVIAENPELFTLPQDEESSDQEVLEVLIFQWNNNDQSSGMAKAVQPDRNRSATTPVEFQHTQQGSYINQLDVTATRFLSVNISGPQTLVTWVLEPLINGLSINAP